MQQIQHDGDNWNVLSAGVTREDGKTFCHLASTTRFVRQRNGQRPVQICDWVAL
jgi:hypothetical protein